jgi:hypothetical protein
MNTQRPPITDARPSSLARPPPVSRQDQLRLELLATVDLLQRCRADLVTDGFVDDYVALHWLQWHGGALKLTVTGTTLCEELRAELR